MATFEEIFSVVRIALFALVFVLALIYAIPIICVRQFHHPNMILTLNICVAMACNSLYWTLFYIMLMLQRNNTYQFMINSCVFVCLFPTIITIQVPYSFVTASINRLYCVIFPRKDSFKKKWWVLICVVSQWTFVTLISLPTLLSIQPYCQLARWVDTYKLIMIVVVPSLAFLISNVLIFLKVRSSTRRVQHSRSSTDNPSNNDRSRQISRRDLHLLRHMVVMFSIFLGGWTPLFILLAVESQFYINPILLASLTIWCQLAMLCDIIDLYLYNHQLRKYLKTMLLRCIR